MLYQITIEIAKTQAILILRINPKLLSDQHYYLILEDFTLVPGQKIEPIELDEEIYEVLRFVKRQNESNMVVSYNKVGSHFHISKVTTKKRLDALQNQGLLSIQIKGRMKSVHITDKGRLLLERRLET